jgi:hypothetical protein
MHNTPSDKAANLLALIRNGLHLHAEKATRQALGDRSRYIGLSDVGRALECPRAALANKVLQKPPGSLQKYLTLQRGHWLEHGMGQALASLGLCICPQLELAFEHNSTPIRAHCDFVLAWDSPRPAIRILELKSTERLPETLYSSYESQLYGQAGFLARFWNDPVFNLRDNGTLRHDKLTMPELCKAQFGLTMPAEPGLVDIEAWVLCISMSEAKPFGPYTPDAAMLDLCLNTAENLWQNKLAVDSGQIDFNSVAYATGFHALCPACDWNADCPKFHDGEYQPEWQAELDKLANLKKARSALELEIEELESNLKEAYALSGTAGNWINTGLHRFRVTAQNGRRSLSRERLHRELMLVIGEEKTEALLVRCEQEGRPFSRLVVNAVN